MTRKNLLIYLTLPLIFVGAFLLGGKIPSQGFKEKNSLVMATGSEEKFAYLSDQRSNKCGMVAENLDVLVDGDSIQGSCCGAMDIHRYQEQVEGLKKYREFSIIPEDPYDIPVSLAKELFNYQKNIQLTSEEQKIYDEAMEMSHEGGPCCCRCWRWTAFEGQAKYLITKEGFDAEKIAELWDLQDGCGGEGHATHEG